jgi:GTP-binding protein
MRPFDQQMVIWCESKNLPLHLVLTKADKLKRGPAQSTLLKLRRELPANASAQVLSILSGEGRNELITRLNQLYGYSPAASTEPAANDKITEPTHEE